MAQTTKDTIQVRKGEELNLAALESFIQQELKDIPDGPLEVEQFGAGHSNLTYLLRIGDWEAVLRRPPLGPVAPKAHDMEREFQILSGLNPLFSPVPGPYLFSKEESIVGSPFFIMERRKGIVLDTDFPKEIPYTEAIGQKISELMVDTLVNLHHIDYKETSLAKLARPDGFMERQVSGWIGRYERAQTDEVKEVEDLKKWLENHVPKSQEPTIIHYDFKLNNAMFSEDFSHVTGLFDWEMATVGDPLADVGVAMSYWFQANDPDLLKNALGKPPVTILNGFYTRDEFIESYAKKSGRNVSNINYYLTFAYFKLAVIGQQIYYRYKKGQTIDPRFAHFNKLANNLIQYALLTATKG